ncbi:hypothetical protein FPZ45_24165 [Cohnella terricola]|uniref:Uncharacterized protein n=2 Tax=Cohnella terricola TaxID=1289167 RepID=A0A559J5H5_9BACL|nr:hypothetical protein FPZ45_24165 [Cohnella terricola]
MLAKHGILKLSDKFVNTRNVVALEEIAELRRLEGVGIPKPEPIPAPKLEPQPRIEGIGEVGKYDTKIKWGINDINARPYGKGFFGERIPQSNPRVDGYELKINPNNESYYLPHPNGGYVQFENLAGNVLQDGKHIIKPKSFYHVDDLPQYAKDKVLQEALRQQESALAAGY